MSTRLFKLAGIASAAMLLLVYGQAYSVTTTSTTFGVTASVSASCALSTVSTLAFGTYDPTLAANKDGTTTISTTCTNLLPYTIALNAGNTLGGSISQRKMQGVVPLNTLNYNLYTDSSKTILWGDGTSGVTVIGIGNGSGQSHTVYGRISSGTSANFDTYSDTVTVTVTY